MTLRYIYVVPVVSLLVLGAIIIFFTVSSPKRVYSGTETLASGSFIINMGVTPQTFSLGLKPYGMIFDLINNYQVPVKWVIDQTKSANGTDFMINATSYKGGCFIVPAEYISSSVSSRITYWTGQGVSGLYTSAAINVPVYATITNFPKLIIDDSDGKEGIIEDYFSNAMIPPTAYEVGMPVSLSYCHDMWANPHGDPTWATHAYLYDLATVAKSFIFIQCHATSVTEGIVNPNPPYQQLNFLTTTGLKCYSGGKCGAIAETHSGNYTTPISYSYPGDPIMQFMGTMHGATASGSEKWYQPVSTGAWRATTKRAVVTSDGTSPNEGAIVAYGPAYGDPNNGMVMYEGGHDLAGSGNAADKTAAQRAFFNFVLLSGITKQIVISSSSSPASLMGNESGNVSVTASSISGGLKYSWTSSIGGTFASPTSANTTYTAPVVGSPTSGYLSCTVTDTCGRKNFVSRIISISTSILPVEMKSFTARAEAGDVKVQWTTSSELNNAHFVIDHSTDGTQFAEIGMVEGNGTSSYEHNYEFLHVDPANGINYYRIRQVDFDGRSELFGPVYVRLNKTATGMEVTNIGSNPFNDRINLEISSEKENQVSVTLLNQQGNAIRSESIFASSGTSRFSMDNLDDLSPGIYFVLITDQVEKKIIRLVKS